MVVFGPWAFASIRDWSMSTMNIAGYALGALFLGKKMEAGRWKRKGRREGLGRGTSSPRPSPPWDGREGEEGAAWGQAAYKGQSLIRNPYSVILQEFHKRSEGVTWILGAVTILLLAWCGVSFLNARAHYVPWKFVFEYHDFIPWLPHSYDAEETRRGFFNYLAQACFFWSVRDWVMGKSERERLAELNRLEPPSHERSKVPDRLRQLLWVLSINGTLLAIEGLVQRASGTGKMLWLLEPVFQTSASGFFGPFAYRGTAASFFNLIWPVTLGFWWLLKREARHAGRTRERLETTSPTAWESLPRSVEPSRARNILIPSALLMAICPIFSMSRGGAIVAVIELVLIIFVLWLAARKTGWRTKVGVGAFFLAVVFFGAFLAWNDLLKRVEEDSSGFSGRMEISRLSREMVKDNPIFGTGPDTFATVFPLYRIAEDAPWVTQLHNDWLETRVTWGGVGYALVLVALGCVAVRWMGPGGVRVQWVLVAAIGIAMGGCLLHARFDFPLQVYAVLNLFLLEAGVLGGLRIKD